MKQYKLSSKLAPIITIGTFFNKLRLLSGIKKTMSAVKIGIKQMTDKIGKPIYIPPNIGIAFHRTKMITAANMTRA